MRRFDPGLVGVDLPDPCSTCWQNRSFRSQPDSNKELAMPHTSSRIQRRITVALWIVQGLLAALFLFAGGMKLVMPIAALTAQTPMPGVLIRFIGVLEVAGALGLVLPALLRLHPNLTPLAAAGLVIVMAGAVGASLTTGPAATALVPVVVGTLLVCIAYGRRWLASQHATGRPTVLRRAA
jgi:DoxX-like family